MSHFVVLVLVKSPVDAKEQVRELLAPFDENIEVDEYDKPCFCINSCAVVETGSAVDAKFGLLDPLRREFYYREDIQAMREQENIDEIEKEWALLIKPRTDLYAELLPKHELYMKPSPDCEDCQGSGTRKSTYNLESQWDWYVIGGRWDGYFSANAESGDSDRYKDNIDGNVNYVYDILKEDKLPFAIVTPDGQWLEKGIMGWFGTVSNADTDWPTRARNILSDYQDHFAVTVDCHI